MKVKKEEITIHKEDNRDLTSLVNERTRQSNLIIQKANEEKKDYLVRAIAKNAELNEKLIAINRTSLSESDLSYAIQIEDVYNIAVQLTNDIRRIIQIGDGIVVKNGEAKRYMRLVEPLVVPVDIEYVNGLLKVMIPLLPSRGIKKDSDMKAIEDAVNKAIETMFKRDIEIAANTRKFVGKKYVIHEKYMIPECETIDIDRIDFSNVIDLLSIEFCCGYDDSNHFSQHIQTVENRGSDSYANIYLVLEDEYKDKLEWIENDV